MLDLLEIAGQTRPFVPSVISTLNPLDRIFGLKQPNGTIKCLSLSSIEIATGHMLEVSPLSSYMALNLFFLLLQLQHLLNQHSLSYIQKRLPIFGCLHLRRCVFIIPQTSLKNQSVWWVLLLEISRTCQAKWIYAWPSKYRFCYEDVKRAIWWNEDFRETLGKIYRQANNNSSSDYKDSELLLQDFINRYVDPSAASPLKSLARLAWFSLIKYNTTHKTDLLIKIFHI